MVEVAGGAPRALEASEVVPTNIEGSRTELRNRVAAFILRIVIIAGALGLWQLFSHYEIVDPFFISSPWRVGERLWEFVATGIIFQHTWVTIQEQLKGYVAGVLIGVTVGFILGHSRLLSAVFLPILNLLNTLPRVALAPLFILWFGIGQLSKVVLVFTVVVVIMIFNTYAGTQTVERDLVTNARLLGAGKWQLMKTITLPWTLPWILTGIRVALAWSIGAAVVGEYLAATEGLGYLIFYYAGILDQTGLIAGCMVLLVYSGLIFGILGVVERRLLRWRPAAL